jgi:ectoine hydroxylase-related dioxygenase (phytanoyl-CoA dioxygenase family)
MLDATQIETFHKEGYLVVRDVLDHTDLDPIRDEYETVLDTAANELFQLGELTSTYADLPFDRRYTAVITECPGAFYYLGISLPLDYETLDPHWIRVHSGPALFGLLTNPKILDVVESVIGPEIALNPVQQTRMKPPERLLTGALAEYSNVGATTWHQDFGALMDEAVETDLLTVWVAMTDATEEMGCLAVMPRSHREKELSLHCPGQLNAAENYIPQQILDRHGGPSVPLPCTAGSIVLLTRWTEHGALSNVSDDLRWSFDLRYQPVGQPTGRPAFPTFTARSRAEPDSVLIDSVGYAALWEQTRQRLLANAFDRPVYEQARWLANRDNPVCA